MTTVYEAMREAVAALEAYEAIYMRAQTHPTAVQESIVFQLVTAALPKLRAAVAMIEKETPG